MLTTTSDKNLNLPPSIKEALVPACSEPTQLNIVEKHWPELEIGQGQSIPLDSLVREYENDKQKKELLVEARKELASRLDEVAPNDLRTWRLRKGYSQAALAEQIGTTQAQIARVEGGQQDAQVGTILKIAEALEIDPIEALRAFVKLRTKST